MRRSVVFNVVAAPVVRTTRPRPKGSRHPSRRPAALPHPHHAKLRDPSSLTCVRVDVAAGMGNPSGVRVTAAVSCGSWTTCFRRPRPSRTRPDSRFSASSASAWTRTASRVGWRCPRSVAEGSVSPARSPPPGSAAGRRTDRDRTPRTDRLRARQGRISRDALALLRLPVRVADAPGIGRQPAHGWCKRRGFGYDSASPVVRRFLTCLILLALAFQGLGETVRAFVCEGASCGTTVDRCCCTTAPGSQPGPLGRTTKVCARPCGCRMVIRASRTALAASASESIHVTVAVAPATLPQIAALPTKLCLVVSAGLPNPPPVSTTPPLSAGAGLRAPPGLA